MKEAITPRICPGAKKQREGGGYDEGNPSCNAPDDFTCKEIGRFVRRVTDCYIRDVVESQPPVSDELA